MKTYDLMPLAFGRTQPSSLFGTLNSLMDTLTTLPLAADTAAWAPRLDVAETADSITVHAEMPGLSENDLDISLRGNLLTIKGEKTVNREAGDSTWHLTERRSGSFSRTLHLPFEPGEDAVEAAVKNGVLHLTVKKPAENGARKIAVKSLN